MVAVVWDVIGVMRDERCNRSYQISPASTRKWKRLVKTQLSPLDWAYSQGYDGVHRGNLIMLNHFDNWTSLSSSTSVAHFFQALLYKPARLQCFPSLLCYVQATSYISNIFPPWSLVLPIFSTFRVHFNFNNFCAYCTSVNSGFQEAQDLYSWLVKNWFQFIH